VQTADTREREHYRERTYKDTIEKTFTYKDTSTFTFKDTVENTFENLCLVFELGVLVQPLYSVCGKCTRALTFLFFILKNVCLVLELGSEQFGLTLLTQILKSQYIVTFFFSSWAVSSLVSRSLQKFSTLSICDYT
jgi:hypothetical protein